MADWTTERLDVALPAGRPSGGARRVLPRPARGWVVPRPRLRLMLFVAGVAAGFLHGWGPHGPRLTDRPVETTPVAVPAWTPILKPVPAFVLETPHFPRDALSLSARRHDPGGGREDVMAFGAADGPRGFARVVAYRPGSEARPVGSLFLELTRRAAEDGFAVVRSSLIRPLPSRFGPLEWAEATLEGGEAQHRCLAWRLVAEEADLRVTGWICGARGAPVPLEAAACFADRFDLAPGQGDPVLKAFFGGPDRRRLPGCPGPRPQPPRRPA